MSAKFARRHYELIAEIIRENYLKSLKMTDGTLQDISSHRVESIANDLADAFRRDNPNFDDKRFMQACGVEE